MREFYERNTTSTRTKVSTTSIAANQLQLLQALASRTVPISPKISGELRKTGYLYFERLQDWLTRRRGTPAEAGLGASD